MCTWVCGAGNTSGVKEENEEKAWKWGSVGLFQQISHWKMQPERLGKGFA